MFQIDLKISYWLPRVLSIGYILFLAAFALDVFVPGEKPTYIFLALLIHLIPNFFLTLILVLAWKKEFLGGIMFIYFAIVFWIFFDNPLLVNLTLFGPLLIIGLLFLFDSYRKKQSLI